MSIHYMSRVLDLDLPPAEKLVLLAFADYADHVGYCFPSIPTVAPRASLSNRGVQRIVSRLEEKGLLIRQPRYRSNGSQTSSAYIILPNMGGDNPSPPRGSCGVEGTRGVTGESPRGVSPVTPLTTNEPPSKNHHNNSSGGGWIFPRSLSEDERATAATLLNGLPDDLAQVLLDELAGRISAGSIRSSRMGYLRSLVGRAKEGTFVAEVALAVASQREQRVSRRQSEPEPLKQVSREVVEEHIKTMRRAVGRGVGHA